MVTLPCLQSVFKTAQSLSEEKHRQLGLVLPTFPLYSNLILVVTSMQRVS